MKKLLVLCIFLSISAGLYAQVGNVFDDFFLSAGPELNANTREGAAIGGSVIFGTDFLKIFAGGLRVIISNNFGEITTIEPLLFFRFYPPLGIKGLFAQLELGASLFLEGGGVYPAFSAGLSAGWRFSLTEKFYIEPYIRGGYPFAWGIGITAGIFLPIKIRSNSGGDQ